MVAQQSNAEKFAEQVHELPNFKNFPLFRVKNKVAEILDMIGRVEGIFSTYTSHDIKHVDEMLKMLNWLIPPTTQAAMTPVDWLLIVLAIYLHDLGMVVTREEFDKRNDNPKFLEFYESLTKEVGGLDYLARAEKMGVERKESFFYQEYIRKEHATRIKEWITGRHSTQWGSKLKPIADEIADILKDLPSRFKENLANVCASHIRDNLDKAEIFPLIQPYGNEENEIANVQYAALILRTVDLLHVTNDRTPSIMYKLIGLSDPKGIDEWKRHMETFSVRMKCREFNPTDPEAHIILVSADFSEERPYFSLDEYLTYANEQIRQSKRWADISQKTSAAKYYSFPWSEILGDIRVEGNNPVQMKFELDRGRLLNLLVGHTIYNDPTVAIRELLQNAIDAVRYQYHLSQKEVKKEKMGNVVVRWNPNPEIRELIVEDNGMGMDLDIIKSHLMHVGSSFYATDQFKADHADFTPISQFGIGVLTCFMVSDDIEIVTCQNGSGYRIKMTSVKGKYLLKELEPGHELLKGLEPHGTRVKLQIRSSVELEKKRVIDIVRYWIILPACNVFYIQEQQEQQKIGFNTPSQALKHFYFEDSSHDRQNIDFYEIIQKDLYFEENEKYEFAYILRKGVDYGSDFLQSEGRDIPAVCIEGIRVDNKLPGFASPLQTRGICSLLSVHGNKRFRTTVSRANLEEDEEYFKVAKVAVDLLFDHIKTKVKSVSEQIGRPLSRASTTGRWAYRSLAESLASYKIRTYLRELYNTLPLIVYEDIESNENSTSRRIISKEELEKIDLFWTIESRLVDSLSIISRDLGRELSLNTFLEALTPELQHLRLTPVVSDAHIFKNEILSTHTVTSAKFSSKDQQTLLQWRRCKVGNFDSEIFLKNDLIFFEMIRKLKYASQIDLNELNRLIYTSYNSLVVSPIIGDIEHVIAINTRIITVIKQSTNLAEIIDIIMKAIDIIIASNLDLNDIYFLLLGLGILRYSTSNNMKDGFIDRYNYIGNRLFNNLTIELFWGEVLEQINSILTKVNISKLPAHSLKNLVGNEENLFDAASYWRDWNQF